MSKVSTFDCSTGQYVLRDATTQEAADLTAIQQAAAAAATAEAATATAVAAAVVLLKKSTNPEILALLKVLGL